MAGFLSAPVWKPRQARSGRWRCETASSKVSATRSRLLNLLSEVALSNPSNLEVAKVEHCIKELIEYRCIPPGSDDLTREVGGWNERLNGRWNLAFSTEAPLRKMLDRITDSLNENGVYQLLEDGNLQNVISTRSLAVVVDGVYEPRTEDDIRKCTFTFCGTRLLTGGAIERFGGMEADGGIDFRFGFAVGKGCFNVVWLDHSLRIDRDTSAKNRDWVNVYVYAGPVVRCRYKLDGNGAYGNSDD